MPLLTCAACAGLVPATRRRGLHCDAPLTMRLGWLRRTLGAATAGVTP